MNKIEKKYFIFQGSSERSSRNLAENSHHVLLPSVSKFDWKVDNCEALMKIIRRKNDIVLYVKEF